MWSDERDDDERDGDDDDNDHDNEDYNNNYNVERERERNRQKRRRRSRTGTTRRPSFEKTGWLSWLQRHFITDEVSGSIPVSYSFKQCGDKSRKMVTKVAFENKLVLVQSLENSFENRMVPGSNLRSETLEDQIVMGSNPFRLSSLLLDYFN